MSYEFYAYAIRRPAIGDMVEAWFARSQQALTSFFEPATARLLDTFIEGLFTYRGWPAGSATPRRSVAGWPCWLAPSVGNRTAPDPVVQTYT